MQITTRNDAAILGAKKYYTGVACVNGHITHRYTNSGQCVECAKDAQIKQQMKYRMLHNSKRANMSFRIHPDDIAAVRMFVDTVEIARKEIERVEAEMAAKEMAAAIARTKEGYGRFAWPLPNPTLSGPLPFAGCEVPHAPATKPWAPPPASEFLKP